jgi:hypothetical protein
MHDLSLSRMQKTRDTLPDPLSVKIISQAPRDRQLVWEQASAEQAIADMRNT